jgi:hypothetical protein
VAVFTFTETPTANVPTTIGPTDTIAVRVQVDTGNLAEVVVCITFEDGGDGRPELVFDKARGSAKWLGPYDNVSESFVQTTSKDWTISFKRNGGWDAPGQNTIRLSVSATNDAGAVGFVNSLDYSISPDPTTAPAVVGFSPVDGSLVTVSETIHFEVTSTVASLDQVEAWAIFAGSDGRRELILRGAAAGPPTVYDPYVLAATTGITNGRSYDVQRAGDGWFDDFTLEVVATQIDAPDTEGAGNAAYTRSPPRVLADTTAPVVGSVSPPAGTAIQTTDPLSFDVTDDSGAFRRVLVCVVQDGTTEVAHDGTSFLGNYAGGSSSRTAISGGFHFVILRDGGWIASPTVRVFAIDLQGNEA